MVVVGLWLGSIVATFFGTLFMVQNNPKVLMAINGFNSFIKKVKNIK